MADSNETDTVRRGDTDATESKDFTVSDVTAGDDGTAVVGTPDDTAPAEARRETPTSTSHIGIPMPSIGGVPLPSPSIDTGAMVRRMMSVSPAEKTPYDAIAESTDGERIGMGYTDEVMSRCGAVKVRGEYPTRARHDEILGESMPPILAKFSRKMTAWMVGSIALGLIWAYANSIGWVIGVLAGIGLFILASVGEMLGLMKTVREADGLDYCAAYESNVKSFDWEKAAELAERG